MSELLTLGTRRRIYEEVGAHAGTHLRELARLTTLPLGTTLYHLDRMEEEGLITARRDGRYKRYFLAARHNPREKEIISALHHDVQRRLAERLLDGAALTQRELAEDLGVSRSTLSFHVNGLVRRGIAVHERGRPEGRYRLEDPTLVRIVLQEYLARYAPPDPPGRAEV